MEFPEAGKHCSFASCKQLDFLPLECKCYKLFCSDHFNEHIANCAAFQNNEQTKLKKITDTYECSNVNCTIRSIVPLICQRCNNHYCIQHRHITECEAKNPEVLKAEKEKYSAPVRQFNEAKAVVDRELDKSINNAKSKSKNRDVANKVQLMRIKNKATGLKTIPVTDRVYFNIQYPKSISNKNCPVFVSKLWTIGRAIDAIAEECKIPNNNNKTNSLKLRLFKQSTGDIVNENVANTLQTVLDTSIIDGENLILEYVADDCFKLNQ